MRQGGPSREQIEPFVESGHVRSATDGKVTIYSYTDLCIYERLWNDVTIHCRGLILDNSSGGRVASPFRKFFNLGEPSCPTLPNLPYEVFEKVDGSLIIGYFYAGEWRFATRGSLDNIYTQWASRFLPAMEHMDIGYTHMFEVVLPKGTDPMPRAVPHNANLIYLGSVLNDRWSEHCNEQRHRETWEKAYGTSAKSYGSPQLDELLKRAEHETGYEGWVIRYEDGTRVKIKTAWYLKVFRAITNLSDKKLRELLADNPDYDAVLMSFPEELREEAEILVTNIAEGFKTKCAQLAIDLHHARKLFPKAAYDREQRKLFAAHIKDHPHKGHLFQLLDGKDIVRDLILTP